MLSLQWIAGFFDGEGCISTTKPSQRSTSRLLRVSIAQANEPILLELKAMFGGYVSKTHKADEKHRTVWNWVVSARKAEHFLRAVQPFCILKSEKITLALELRQIMNDVDREQDEEGKWLPDTVGEERAERVHEIALRYPGA